jgi:nitroreductase
MDTKELIFARHSVRNFLPDPIPEAVLSDILEAGRLAPSAQNRQPWRYLVFSGEDSIQKLVQNCGLIGLSIFFIRKAPCVIIACAETKSNLKMNGQDYYLVDTAISFHQMMLMARSHGIGSCWLAAFSEKKLRSYLKIPDSWRVVALSPFGYPAEKKTTYTKLVSSFAGSETRKPLSEIVQYR